MVLRGLRWFFVAMACLALAACSTNGSQPPPKQAPPSARGQVRFAAGSPQLAHIRTEAVVIATVPVGSVTAPGKVEANANRLAHVVLPVAGRVSTVLVRIGDLVEQGQPVLTVESADVDAAVAAFQQSQAGLTQARSLLTKAQADLDRAKDLFEHGAVPQKEVLHAQTLTVQAQAGVEQAEAVQEQSRRRLELLGVKAGSFGQRVTIHAPISGKVLEMSVVNGEFRNDLSAPLMTIADLSSVWITSDVPETAIRLVKRGEPVKIDLAAHPRETFRGRVTMIGDTVDPQTRTVKVRAEIQNADGRLKPEMFGSMQLVEQTEERPTVPASSIVATDGATMLWKETAPGTFERVAVTTGPQTGNRVAILRGVGAADRIVVDGVMLLADGIR
jgi:membrane fusion protein, heavy metal efflux system